MRHLRQALFGFVLMSTGVAAQPVGTVSGTASDLSGAPVADAVIRVSEYGGRDGVEVGTTDEAGHFEAPILSGPGWVCLTADVGSAEGYRTCVLVSSGRESVVDLLVLPSGGAIVEDDGSLGFPEVPLISRSPYRSVFYYPAPGGYNYGAPFVVHR